MILWIVSYVALGMVALFILWIWAENREKRDAVDLAISSAAELFFGSPIVVLPLVVIRPVLAPILIWKILPDPPDNTKTSEKPAPTGKKELVGLTGTVTRALEPAGIIQVDEMTIDALANHGCIEEGAVVEIIAQDHLHARVKIVQLPVNDHPRHNKEP